MIFLMKVRVNLNRSALSSKDLTIQDKVCSLNYNSLLVGGSRDLSSTHGNGVNKTSGTHSAVSRLSQQNVNQMKFDHYSPRSSVNGQIAATAR